MRAVTASSVVGFGASAFVLLVLAGCPPTFFEPCRGFECGLDDGGAEVGDEVRSDVPPTPNPPKIDDVVVEGNPSRTVRQGFGGDPTKGTTLVHLTGERLDEVTEVKIGSGANALVGAITEQFPRALSFTVKVVHGAPFGAQSVNVTAPSGAAMSEPVFVISRITASPVGSDALERDSATAGTDVQPLRSMAKAITFAQAGDTVFLKNGTYDVKHGEIGKAGTKVPVDVTVQGESRDGTLLQWVDGSSGGLVLEGNGRIESLGIVGSAGVSTEAGAVTIKDVSVRGDGGGGGISVGPNTVLDSVDITETEIAVPVAVADGTLVVKNSHIHGNRSGIDAQFSNIKLIVTATEIDHNCPNTMGRAAAGILVNGAAILTEVRVHDNACPGVVVTSDGSSGPLTITGGTFSANGGVGLALDGAGRTTVRAASFGNQDVAISVGPGASLDLGTPQSPGNNRFTRCITCDMILDARDAPAQGANPITVFGNKWEEGPDETILPSGCFDFDFPKGSTSPPRIWRIAHPGTCSPMKGNVIVN